MFWIFMLIFGAAATFTTLGMLFVWFKVLSVALIVAAVTLLGLLVIFCYAGLRKSSRKNNVKLIFKGSKLHGHD